MPDGSGAYSTPREPGSSSGAGDTGAGGEGLFQMGMFGAGFASLLGPQAWFDAPVAAATAQGVIVGEQDGHGGAAAGTSTLSFALG